MAWRRSLPLLLVTMCAPARTTTGNDSLIGGDVAATDAFPATFQFVDNCTVTRIAKHLVLTASHCVREENGELALGFLPGAVRTVRRAGAPRAVHIVKTTMHPALEHYCRVRGCPPTAIASRYTTPDIAVVEIQEDLDEVATATASIDVAPVVPGTAVTMLGYGCLTQIDIPDSDGALSSKDTTSVPITEALILSGPLRDTDADRQKIADNFVVTRGPQSPFAIDAGASEAGLCPGDSGGALYRVGTSRVVGVNSSYTFRAGSRIPKTNWHARVDGRARWGVAAWLESMGATMSEPCTKETCTPIEIDETLEPIVGG